MKVINVQAFTRYDSLGASSRIRFMQFASELADRNVSLTVHPLFSNEYVKSLQLGQGRLRFVFNAYLKRLIAALKVRNSYDIDVVWIEKELLPWVPYFLENLFWPRRIPVILDYDDAVFHIYDKSPNYYIRKTFSNKHANLINDALMVFAGNSYLKSYATAANAKNIEIIPTVIDLSKYDSVDLLTRIQHPRIGWIGQASTAKYLKNLLHLLNDLQVNNICEINTIGYEFKDFCFLYTPWSEETEAADIANFDIGIMPLADDHFERGKCGYKLIQYMACGLPVIASPVGANCEIVEHGVNGFLASTIDEWSVAINTLLYDPLLRARMGAAGRIMVEKKYNTAIVSDKLASYFHSISSTSDSLSRST
jgi:glycosyltransferase involved in cell wall biosynthesis